MLPKAHRLSKKSDFDRVYKRGQRIKIDNLLFSLLRTNHEASHLGFVVSKKISNKATRRNYLKRVMRAAFATLPEELPLSYDVIVSLLQDASLKSEAMPAGHRLRGRSDSRSRQVRSLEVSPFKHFSGIKTRLVGMVNDGRK